MTFDSAELDADTVPLFHRMVRIVPLGEQAEDWAVVERMVLASKGRLAARRENPAHDLQTKPTWREALDLMAGVR